MAFPPYLKLLILHPGAVLFTFLWLMVLIHALPISSVLSFFILDILR